MGGILKRLFLEPNVIANSNQEREIYIYKTGIPYKILGRATALEKNTVDK